MQEIKGVFAKINPSFTDDWVIDSTSSHCGYAQAVCTPGFRDKLPATGGYVDGLFHADTTSYYPQDRWSMRSFHLPDAIQRSQNPPLFFRIPTTNRAPSPQKPPPANRLQLEILAGYAHTGAVTSQQLSLQMDGTSYGIYGLR
jgi:hypothetical protein